MLKTNIHIYVTISCEGARAGERAVVGASLVLQLGNMIAKRFWLKGPKSDFLSCISVTCSSASFPLDGPGDPAQRTWLLSQNLLSRIDPLGAQPGISLWIIFYSVFRVRILLSPFRPLTAECFKHFLCTNTVQSTLHAFAHLIFYGGTERLSDMSWSKS